VRIPWLEHDFLKEDRIIPKDNEVADFMANFDKTVPSMREDLINKHKIHFASSAKNSLIYLYVLFKLLGDYDAMSKVEYLFSLK